MEQVTISREYQIKAAFLFNFTQFVEWPESTFSSTNDPLVIGILGKDPFSNYIDETVSGEKVNGHSLIVQRYERVEEIKKCHIVYINDFDSDNLKEVIAYLKGRGILTVGDNADFINSGGMIRFFRKNNKIQFQINPEAAKAEQLVISSKMLSVAEITSPQKK